MRRTRWILFPAALLMAFFWMRPVRADSHWGANYFPNVELTDQYGVKHHFYDDLLKGKIVAIELFYTHCLDVCPLETARLVQVQKMLGDRVGKDIFFYSLSIDPKRDSPEMLKAYAEKYHAGPGWLFLTGKPEDIELVSKKLGLWKPPDPNDRDGHSAHLMLGNEATGQWMRNSAVDNPRYLAILIGDWLNNWTSAKKMTSGASYTEAGSIKMDQGKYLFHTQCAACHTIGGGESIGPDLKGLTTIRDPLWFRKIIQAPEQLIDDKDPLATALFEKYNNVRMPNLHMDGEATELLISYMEKQSAVGNAPGGSTAAPAENGNTVEQPR